jgi:hypothetical protein
MEIDICPRWVLVHLRLPAQYQYHVALLVSTVLALAFLPVAMHVPHFCLIRTFLGIPCPGCGVSHSIMAILHLNLIMAWNANPAGIAVALFFCFQLVARPIAIMAPRTSDLISHASRYISNLVLGGLLVVWILRVIVGGLNGGNFLF